MAERGVCLPFSVSFSKPWIVARAVSPRRKPQNPDSMKLRFAPLLWGALMGGLFSVQTQAQESAYLPLEDAVGSDWSDDEISLEDPDSPWNHDNGSDQWEGVLGIIDGGDMP